MAKNLQDTLRELQIILGKPHRELAGRLKYYLDFFNTGKTINEAEKAPKNVDKVQTLKHKKITWMDIQHPTRKEISKLAEKYPFHPLHLEDCISKGQFPKIEENIEDKYLFFLLRFPRYKPNDEKIIINQICFFLGKNYLVTIHDDSTDAISNIFKECEENIEQRDVYINGASAHLLYVIIDQLTKDLFPLSQAILQEVDEAEDVVFDDKVSAVYKVGQLRQKIISLRRAMRPLRTLAAELEEKISKFSSLNLSVYFENIFHRIEKTWETLEEARETVEIYKDADFTFSTEKTNRILAVLTIIFTLSIPATVIGTFYGMNIVLPGGIEAGGWTFWGKYTTFIIVALAAVIPALIMHLYFRKRGWF